MNKPAWMMFEPAICVLQTPAACLNYKVIYKRYKCGVEDCVDQVEAPLQVVDAYRRGLDLRRPSEISLRAGS